MQKTWNGGAIESPDGVRFEATYDGEFLGKFFSEREAEMAISNRKARKALDESLAYRGDAAPSDPSPRPSRPRG